MRPTIADRLRGGDRRQLGNAEAIALEIARHDEKFGELFEAMLDDDPVVRMRAADATEKVARTRPDLLAPYRKRLIDEIGEIEQDDVRRHVAQMLSRVRLDPKERSRATRLLERYLQATSVILVVEALQTLVDFSAEDRMLRKRITPIVHRLATRGTPAMQVRGKKLLDRLSQQGERKTPQPRR